MHAPHRSRFLDDEARICIGLMAAFVDRNARQILNALDEFSKFMHRSNSNIAIGALANVIP